MIEQTFNGITHTIYDDEYLTTLTTLNTHLTTIKGYMDDLITITAAMKSDIDALKQRAEDPNLGIYTSQVVEQDALTRAVVIVNLRRANLLEAVRQEMLNPTSVPLPP